jgi:hypothetical protein
VRVGECVDALVARDASPDVAGINSLIFEPDQIRQQIAQAKFRRGFGKKKVRQPIHSTKAGSITF